MAAIEINGKRITNPLILFVIGISAVFFVGIIAALVIFLILPLAGVVLTFSVGLTIVVLLAVLVGLPFIILFKIILWILLKPLR